MKESEKKREEFNKSFSYKDIGSKEVSVLIKLIEEELSNYKNKVHPSFKMTLCKVRKKDVLYDNNGSLKELFLIVSGVNDGVKHFKRREAISFNCNGFIGFCGWADDSNQKPFLNAFDNFIGFLKNK